MKHLKINLENEAELSKIAEILMQIKGIKSVEMVNDAEDANDLKKAINKSKEQLKTGDYESFVNDLFDTFVNHKS